MAGIFLNINKQVIGVLTVRGDLMMTIAIATIATIAIT